MAQVNRNRSSHSLKCESDRALSTSENTEELQLKKDILQIQYKNHRELLKKNYEELNGQPIPFKSEDPIFSMIGPIEQDIYSKDIKDCLICFNKNVAEKSCQFCSLKCCKDCIKTKRRFPSIKSDQNSKKEDKKKGKGLICRICERKFQMRDLREEKDSPTQQKEDNIKNLYHRYRMKKDNKEQIIQEINELKEKIIVQDSKRKMFDDEKKQEIDLLQEQVDELKERITNVQSKNDGIEKEIDLLRASKNEEKKEEIELKQREYKILARLIICVNNRKSKPISTISAPVFSDGKKTPNETTKDYFQSKLTKPTDNKERIPSNDSNTSNDNQEVKEKEDPDDFIKTMKAQKSILKTQREGTTSQNKKGKNKKEIKIRKMNELAHHQNASSLDYKEWNLQDVLSWLEEHLKLSNYKDTFSNLRIDGSLLDHITDQDLQNDFGINVRLHRVKIIEGIKKLQVQAQKLHQMSQIQQQQIMAQIVAQNQQNSQIQNQVQLNTNQVPQVSGFNIAQANCAQQVAQPSFSHINIAMPNPSQYPNIQPSQQATPINQQPLQSILLPLSFLDQRVDTPPHNNQRVDPNQVMNPAQNIMVNQRFIGNAQSTQLNEILVLKAVEGQLLNNVYIVGENGAALGRHSASNDIVISESFVSRRHCEIKYINDETNAEQGGNKFYLRDIGSTTGSFIMVRSEVYLKQNMMFQMGLSEFRVIQTSKKNMIELHVFEGPARNRIITVDDLGLGIGRDQNNTFCVQDDSQMSNFHAKITYNKGGEGLQEGFYLQDVGSTNRTWLRLSSEGEQSNLHPLKVSDIIKIGSTVFVVQSNDIANLKNMPVINKRGIQPGQNPGGQNSYEEEKNSYGEQIVVIQDGNQMNDVQMQNQADNNLSPSGQYSADACKICYESERDAAFIPCGHNFACINCALRCEVCPVCKKQIFDRMKLYKS